MAFYWYQSDPDLYRAEVQAMNKFFPSFTIHQLPDGSGRLYWRGKVQPAGPDGMVWDLMLIYKNDHPHAGASEYGGSIQILPVQPRLKDIATRMMPILEETYQTTAAREAIGYFIQRILQQFNNVNHSWNDQQSRRLYAIVLDSVTSLRTSYGELRSLEESLKKTLDTVEKYEQIGRATRTTAAAGVAAAASVASAGTKTAVSIRPSIKQDKPFSSPKYNAILDQRYGNAVPAARKVFDLFAEKLCILNGDYSGPEPSHYSPAEHGVYYNAAEDEKNVRGAGATYYHELGHMIDHACMRYQNLMSENAAFHHALVSDGQRLIQCYNNSTPEQRERAVRNLCEGAWHSCSDLANFATNGHVHGGWGHSEEYCARVWAMEHEAFAHFFEASMGDSIKLQRLTKLFPNAVRVFNQMLSAIIKNAEPYDREQRERAIWEER